MSVNEPPRNEYRVREKYKKTYSIDMCYEDKMKGLH